MDKADTDWIFYNEEPDRRTSSSWRKYLKDLVDRSQQKFIAKLSPENLYYIGWNVRRARIHRSDAKGYKGFLRAVGGAGDSDWYNTKAEMDYGAEAEDLYLQMIKPFSEGDLGTRQEDVERFVESHRERYEERKRRGLID